MSDHQQTKAVRVQSSAIVLAAVITTGGAVTSAFIQTGLLGKLSPTGVAVSQMPAEKAPAFVAEGIDLPSALSFAVSPAVSSPASLPQPKMISTGAAKVSFHAPVAESQPAPASVSAQTWTVSKPELLPVEATAKPVVSPWYYLQQSTAGDVHAASVKMAKKPLDWGTITRFFQLHN
jgi:hypothetical protein